MSEVGESAGAMKSRAHRIGGALLGVVVIVAIFVGVIPQFANYKDAWAALVTCNTHHGPF